MALAVAKPLIGPIVDKVGNKVMANVFDQLGWSILKEDDGGIGRQLENVMSQIATTEQRIIDNMELLFDKTEYRKLVFDMIKWQERYQQATSGTTPQMRAENMKTFSKRAWGQTEGRDDGLVSITSLLTSIHLLLVPESRSESAGLLSSFAKGLRKNLASDASDYDVDWYLRRIDGFLSDAISLQLCGLTYQILGISCPLETGNREQLINYATTKMMKNLDLQIQAAYNAMHPTVKQLKGNGAYTTGSYTTPIDYGRWWRIKQKSDGTVLQCMKENNEIWRRNQTPDRDNCWRLMPVQDSGKHTIVCGRMKNVRVRLAVYDVLTMGGHSERQVFNCWEGQRDGKEMSAPFDDKISFMHDFAPLKFKFAPCELTDGFKFISSYPIGGHWFWDMEFQLDDSGVAQFDQPERPALHTLEGKFVRDDQPQNVNKIWSIVMHGKVREVNSNILSFFNFSNREKIQLDNIYFYELPKGPRIDRARLYRKQGDTAVFFFDGDRKHYIPSVAGATIYGLDMGPGFSKVEVDEWLTSVDGPWMRIAADQFEGQRIKGDSHEWYFVLDKSLRWIRGGEVFESLFTPGSGLTMQKPQLHIDSMEKGPELAAGTKLVTGQADSKIYLIDQGKKRYLAGSGVFERYRFDRNRVQKVSDDEIKRYPDGASIF